MALDRRKMFFFQGAVETQAEHDKRMEAWRRKIRTTSKPNMLFASMLAMTMGLEMQLTMERVRVK